MPSVATGSPTLNPMIMITNIVALLLLACWPIWAGRLKDHTWLGRGSSDELNEARGNAPGRFSAEVSLRAFWFVLTALLFAVTPALAQIKLPRDWTLESSRAFFVNKTHSFELPKGGQMTIYFSGSDVAYIQLPGQKTVVTTHWNAVIDAQHRPFAICLLFDNSTAGANGWMGDWRCVSVPSFAATIVEQFAGDHFNLEQGKVISLGSSPAAINLLGKNGFPLVRYVSK